MHNVFDTNLPSHVNPAQRWRLLAITAGIIGYALSRLPLLTTINTTADWLGWQVTPFILVNLVFMAAIVAAYVQARQQNLKSASMLVVGVLVAESALYLVLGSWTSPRGWALLWAGVILSHLLLDQRQSRMVILASLVIIVTGAARDIDADN